jgi:hypothetical protein
MGGMNLSVLWLRKQVGNQKSSKPFTSVRGIRNSYGGALTKEAPANAACVAGA